MGASMQFRYLGGAVGFGIVTAIFNSGLRSHLGSLLTPEDVSKVLESTDYILRLPIPVQHPVKQVFQHSFAIGWRALLGFICAQIPAALMML